MYLPAGPSGHIVSSNYDLYSEFYMGWVFTIILYILVRLLFYFALRFCAHPPSPQPFGRGFRWGGIPLTIPVGRLAEGSGGGESVNNVTHDYLFYAGFLLNYVCACEFYLYEIVLCVL